MAVHLASQTLPTDNREPEARLLKPCALVAEGGNVGMGRCMVEFDCMVSPLGTITLIAGLCNDVGTWGRWDVSRCMTKLSVAPVSAWSVRL